MIKKITLKLRKIWGVIMEDSFEKLADIIKENSLGGQALDYLADIKRELKEKERLEAVVERCQIENNTLYEALIIACKELEEKDYK